MSVHVQSEQIYGFCLFSFSISDDTRLIEQGGFLFFFFVVFFCFVFKTDGQKQSFTINCCTSVLQAVEEASYSLWTSLDAVALEEQL